MSASSSKLATLMLRFLIMLLAFHFLPHAQAAENEVATARETVKAFYDFHLAHDMGFTAENVTARAKWLTPALLESCRRYLAKPGSPDEVPDIDGDPFTDSQEYPSAYEIRKVVANGDTSHATLRFTGKGLRPVSLEVLLRRTGGEWRIDDVRYGHGPSLRKLVEGS
jgi:hypothetical protein